MKTKKEITDLFIKNNKEDVILYLRNRKGYYSDKITKYLKPIDAVEKMIKNKEYSKSEMDAVVQIALLSSRPYVILKLLQEYNGSTFIQPYLKSFIEKAMEQVNLRKYSGWGAVLYEATTKNNLEIGLEPLITKVIQWAYSKKEYQFVRDMISIYKKIPLSDEIINKILDVILLKTVSHNNTFLPLWGLLVRDNFPINRYKDVLNFFVEKVGEKTRSFYTTERDYLNAILQKIGKKTDSIKVADLLVAFLVFFMENNSSNDDIFNAIFSNRKINIPIETIEKALDKLKQRRDLFFFSSLLLHACKRKDLSANYYKFLYIQVKNDHLHDAAYWLVRKSDFPEDLKQKLIKKFNLKIKAASNTHPFTFQNDNQEMIIHGKNPKFGSWDKGNSYRFVLEGTGDIFRELCKGYIDKGYIKEKIRRLKRYFDEGHHPEDSFQYSYDNNKDKFEEMINLWGRQPTTSDLQKKAIELNLAMLENDITVAKKLTRELEENLNKEVKNA